MIKLIIVDDHKIFREGIISLLEEEKEIEVMAEARDGQELLHLLKGLKPHIILMDIEMPKLGGIQATREVNKLYPNIKIVALSMHKKSVFVKQMLKAGASGYIQKDVSKAELIMAIKKVYKEGTYFTHEMSSIALLSLKEEEKEAEITNREIEIIKLITEQNTTEEIANLLSISKHTVESHRQNILLKLNLKNTAGLVRYAIEHRLIES